MTRIGILFILLTFGLIWFGGLGQALGGTVCTVVADATVQDALMSWFLCSFWGFFIFMFLLCAMVATVLL